MSTFGQHIPHRWIFSNSPIKSALPIANFTKMALQWFPNDQVGIGDFVINLKFRGLNVVATNWQAFLAGFSRDALHFHSANEDGEGRAARFHSLVVSISLLRLLLFFFLALFFLSILKIFWTSSSIWVENLYRKQIACEGEVQNYIESFAQFLRNYYYWRLYRSLEDLISVPNLCLL